MFGGPQEEASRAQGSSAPALGAAILTLPGHHPLRVPLGQHPRVPIEAGLLHLRERGDHETPAVPCSAETRRPEPRGAGRCGQRSHHHPWSKGSLRPPCSCGRNRDVPSSARNAVHVPALGLVRATDEPWPMKREQRWHCHLRTRQCKLTWASCLPPVVTQEATWGGCHTENPSPHETTEHSRA